MNATTVILVGVVIIPVGGLILALLLARRVNSPAWKEQNAAHEDALVHLAGVIRGGADRAPDPAAIRAQVSAVLEYLEYPKRGDISEWEERVASMLSGPEGGKDPTGPWAELMEELFEFARVNLYSAFMVQGSIASYNDVRTRLAAVGLEAKPVEDLGLGRL